MPKTSLDQKAARTLCTRAYNQLSNAITALGAAQAYLRDLQGEGYADVYFDTGALRSQVYDLKDRLAALPPPAGIARSNTTPKNST